MEAEFDSQAARGLARYIRLVAEAFGLTGIGSYIHWGPPTNAYLALEGRLARVPNHDVALVWDEERGWAIGLESTSTEDLIILRHLGDEVLPAPHLIAECARRVIAGEPVGRQEPTIFRSVHDNGLEEQLTAYARVETRA